MARTNTERFQQAVNYIKDHISLKLASSIMMHSAGRQDALGGAISLSKSGFWRTGSDGQHMALRSLLLCQHVFLKPPFLNADVIGDTTPTKTHFQTRSEHDIREAIRIYSPLKNVTLHQFAEVARNVGNMAGQPNLHTRTRRDVSNWGGVSNCYSGVKVWLFQSGLCSFPWLLKEGNQITAYTVNGILGDGRVVAEKDIRTVPEGFIFNIHDANDANICHWGVGLGNGKAAAANTTAGGMNSNRQTVMVNFTKGNSGYGEFDLQSSVDVCKCTYNSKRVVLKVVDPTRGNGYY
jgi:hypothetical protein